MASGETIRLYDKNDYCFDTLELPGGVFGPDEMRWIVVDGKKYVEGGGPDSFYGKGQFAEVD